MISEKFKKTILNELNLYDFDIQDDTTADQVPGWDSLNHINVILAVEKAFDVHFKGIEVLKCKNIGELQKLVNTKLDQK
ncbi:MAG: acyl carrier protein [Ignavibacteriales bacterium CG_4_9_14_3_um_filter_30_11]|nr:MAG: acyl carrier protein [Ignavibacteriales bacterium CG_4_9_14_3_um_filter_30_11]